MHTHNSEVAETHRQNGGRETDVYRKYGVVIGNYCHIICFVFSGCYGFQQSKVRVCRHINQTVCGRLCVFTHYITAAFCYMHIYK